MFIPGASALSRHSHKTLQNEYLMNMNRVQEFVVWGLVNPMSIMSSENKNQFAHRKRIVSKTSDAVEYPFNV